MSTVQSDEQRWRILEQALPVMAEFERAFGRRLDADFIAELHVSKELGLDLCVGINNPGYDASGPEGERYQIKRRSLQTLNVDVNNFDFDHLVLVNLDENYQPVGMWRMTVAEARAVFTWRGGYRKYQAAQSKVKDHAQRIL